MTANTPEAISERCLELERLLREKDDELAAVRKALRYGADDSLWPPGQSMGDVVERLVETRTRFEWEVDGCNLFNDKQYFLWLRGVFSPEPYASICHMTGFAATGEYDDTRRPFWRRMSHGEGDEGFVGSVEEAYAAIVAHVESRHGPVAAKIIPPLP